MLTVIAANHRGRLGIEAEHGKHLPALRIERRLARRHLDTLSNGVARSALPFDIDPPQRRPDNGMRSEEHTSELQSLMRISYAVFCLKKITSHITQSP